MPDLSSLLITPPPIKPIAMKNIKLLLLFNFQMRSLLKWHMLQVCNYDVLNTLALIISSSQEGAILLHYVNFCFNFVYSLFWRVIFGAFKNRAFGSNLVFSQEFRLSQSVRNRICLYCKMIFFNSRLVQELYYLCQNDKIKAYFEKTKYTF